MLNDISMCLLHFYHLFNLAYIHVTYCIHVSILDTSFSYKDTHTCINLIKLTFMKSTLLSVLSHASRLSLGGTSWKQNGFPVHCDMHQTLISRHKHTKFFQNCSRWHKCKFLWENYVIATIFVIISCDYCYSAKCLPVVAPKSKHTLI